MAHPTGTFLTCLPNPGITCKSSPTGSSCWFAAGYCARVGTLWVPRGATDLLPSLQPAQPQSSASRFWPHTHLLGVAVLLLMLMLSCQLGASRNYSSQPGAGVLLHPAARSSMGCSSPPATVDQGALMFLIPFGDSQCLAGSPANPRSCVRSWQSPPGGAALGPSNSAPQLLCGSGHSIAPR